VWGLKRDFPGLDFSLNGGVEGCHQAAAALQHVSESGARIHGVMIGRAAFHAPWACLADADAAVFGAAYNAALNRREVLRRYAEYGDAVLGRFGSKEGGAVRYPGVRAVAKPLLGLFHGSPGGRRWRNVLDQELLKKPATLSAALEVLPFFSMKEPAGAITFVSSAQ
jgi:tRNA-dihydrouridine synthase A